MALLSKIVEDLEGLFEKDYQADNTTSDAQADLQAAKLQTALQQVADTAAAVGGRIITDPKGTLESVIADAKVAVWGHDGPHPVQDAVNFVKGAVGITQDSMLKIFNGIAGESEAVQYERQENAVSAAEGAVITSRFTTGASIGDMSWLIYKGRLNSNQAMQDKWTQYKEVETSHGFNSCTYVNAADKQVVITLEGTQANSDLSPLWLSKDGLSDLEIGLGIIPPQMREGYEEFKNIVADAVNSYVADGYSISVAGHSLGGGLAQMMAGMYYVDTGVALPTLAEAGPGMLAQLKLYAQEQLLAGKEIHLPSGNVVSLQSGSLVDQATEAKAIVDTFKAQDFSFVTNMITEGDPVGAVNYNADPDKDGHVGVSVIVPYLLTAREDLQDLEYVAIDGANAAHLVTPELTDKLGLGGIWVTRFDRHEPDQSAVLWSGTAVGFKDPSIIGTGSAVYRAYLDPRQVWEGSSLSLPEVSMFGTGENDYIEGGDKAAQIYAGEGNDVIKGGNVGSILDGGLGDDYILGGSGDDYIAGGKGNDSLYGGAGNDIIYGGEGNDYLDGGKGSDLLFGGAGDDTLIWSDGNDILCGNEGNDTMVVREGVQGQAQIKWERNYSNFGNDTVVFEGAMAKDSSILMNFADEIRFQDMRWSVNGNDIVMTDNLGDSAATVTFKDAFDTFAQNSGSIDMQFTNGRLYVDDVMYNVQAGAGEIKANTDEKYKGTIMVGSQGADTLYSGKGDDLMFGGAGKDAFVFGNTFGNDTIAGGASEDVIQFTNAFNAKEYSISQNNNDLVISYQQTGMDTTNSLTISDWFTSADHIDTVQFSNGSYSISENGFTKQSAGC